MSMNNLNIFSEDKIYGGLEKIGKDELFNTATLAGLNTKVPGVVFQGPHGLSVKLFVKGSVTQFICKTLDTRSTAYEGSFFDVTKCKVSTWKKAEECKLIYKILVEDDAIV